MKTEIWVASNFFSLRTFFGPDSKKNVKNKLDVNLTIILRFMFFMDFFVYSWRLGDGTVFAAYWFWSILLANNLLII